MGTGKNVNAAYASIIKGMKSSSNKRSSDAGSTNNQPTETQHHQQTAKSSRSPQGSEPLQGSDPSQSMEITNLTTLCNQKNQLKLQMREQMPQMR